MVKYLHVRDELRDLAAELPAGQALPAERALAAQLGVSRMTVRKAIDELSATGLLFRRHGSGTFVSPKIEQVLTATSFTEDMRSRGLKPGAADLGSTFSAAGAVLGRRLELSPRAEILRLRRLRLADGAPMAIEMLHVPVAVVPGLTGADLVGRSYYAVLRERFGLTVAGGTQVLEATVTDAEESKILRVPEHSPAFLFERTSRDAEGRILEFVRSIYRGDRYRITAPLQADYSHATEARSSMGAQ